jgi:hypothetical protein
MCRYVYPEEIAYRAGDFYIRDQMMPGILRYVEEGILPGQFLQAVICNDLVEACRRADEENLRNLPAFVAYFYDKVPQDRWGSREKMEAWIDLKKKERSK